MSTQPIGAVPPSVQMLRVIVAQLKMFLSASKGIPDYLQKSADQFTKDLERYADSIASGKSA